MVQLLQIYSFYTKLFEEDKNTNIYIFFEVYIIVSSDMISMICIK